jgi:hypothetical protein
MPNLRALHVLLQVLVPPLYGWLGFPWLSPGWIVNTCLEPQSAAVDVFGPEREEELVVATLQHLTTKKNASSFTKFELSQVHIVGVFNISCVPKVDQKRTPGG